MANASVPKQKSTRLSQNYTKQGPTIDVPVKNTKYKTVTNTKQWRIVDVPDKNTKYETAPNTKHGKSYCPKTKSTRRCSQTQAMSNHAILENTKYEGLSHISMQQQKT